MYFIHEDAWIAYIFDLIFARRTRIKKAMIQLYSAFGEKWKHNFRFFRSPPYSWVLGNGYPLNLQGLGPIRCCNDNCIIKFTVGSSVNEQKSYRRFKLP